MAVNVRNGVRSFAPPVTRPQVESPPVTCPLPVNAPPTIRYDTIRYDTVYLTCSKKLTGSQLSPPHGTNKKLKCETKNTRSPASGWLAEISADLREAVVH